MPAYVPFTPNVRVNRNNLGFDHQVEPTMVIDSTGKIYVGWKEAFTHDGGGQRTGFAYSVDGGDTFSQNILMGLARLQRQSDPWLTITGDDRVHFTRIEYNTAGTAGGFTVTNTTDGVTWGTDHFFDDTPAFADKESAAHDAAGNLYVVWNSDAGGNYPLVFSRSNDGGTSWTSKVRVSDAITGNLGGIVKVHPDGTVLATWWSWGTNNVLFDRSLDGGVTWGTDIRVNDRAGSATGYGNLPVLPAMAVAPDGSIYITWEDSRNGDMDIMFSRSTNGGVTWSPAVRVNDDNSGQTQWMPDLALDPFGGIHLAWEDDRTGNHTIRYANSTDGGRTFGPNVLVSTAETPLVYWRPGDYLAVESDPNGTICVVWTDGRGADHDIYFAKLERLVGYHVDTSPSGLMVDVDGVPTPTPATFSWAVNSTHTLSATSPQAAGPQSQHVFDRWSDALPQTHAVRVGPSGGSTVAIFHMEYEVTVRTQPVPLSLVVDGATITAPATYWWRALSSHTVSAPSPQQTGPGERYAFSAWSDTLPQAHVVNATAAMTLEAVFRAQYLLAVTSAHGTPTGGGWFDADAVAPFSIEATVAGAPGTRYQFDRWSGDSTITTPAADVVMDGPKTVIATWRTEHRLTVNSDHGTPTGAGWYTEGAQATVTIEDQVTVDNVTYVFKGWTGDVTDTSSLVLVSMDRPKTLTATWEVSPPSGGPAQTFADVWPWLIVIAVLVIAILLFVVWRRRRKKEDEARPPAPPA